MRNKKLLCTLLAALLLASAGLTGCGGNAGDEKQTSDVGSESGETATSEEETEEASDLSVAAAQYKDRNYNGYKLRVAVRESSWLGTIDVYADEITGDVVNDAVYLRNSTLENKMNIEITEIRLESPASAAQTSITAVSDDYDMITDGMKSLSPLSTRNLLVDFQSIDTIHLENEWWDQNMVRDLSILGRNYFMTGEISVMDNAATWCYLFNKDMVKDLGLENPYTLVDEGKWTLDKHNEMAEKAISDVDGDGKWTDEDTYGLVTERYNTLALWSCMGYKIADRDTDGNIVYTYSDENAITALTKIIDTQYAGFTNMGTGSPITEGGVEVKNGRERQFAIGRSLFYYAAMTNIVIFRDSDVDFGVLPAPKENEDQEEYYSSWSYSNMAAYVLPKTLAKPEMIGDIMEAMAHLSVYTLTPAYMDQTLIGQGTRDEESEPMIRLILDTRNYDLGVVFDWGGIRTAILGMSDSQKVASSLSSLTTKANKELEEYLVSVEEDR